MKCWFSEHFLMAAFGRAGLNVHMTSQRRVIVWFAFNSVCASYIRCISFIISYRGGCRTHAASFVWFFVTLLSGSRPFTDVTGSFILDVLESLIRLSLIILNGYNTKFCFGNRLERFVFYSKYHKRRDCRFTKSPRC